MKNSKALYFFLNYGRANLIKILRRILLIIFVLLLIIQNLYDIFEIDCMRAAQILFYFDEKVVFVSGDLLCENFGCSLIFRGVYLFDVRGILIFVTFHY